MSLIKEFIEAVCIALIGFLLGVGTGWLTCSLASYLLYQGQL